MMKKLAHLAILTLVVSSWAQAQVHFDSGSARPLNPRTATRDLERQLPDQARTPPKAQRVLVECRDGSRHIARVCRRHGWRAARAWSKRSDFDLQPSKLRLFLSAPSALAGMARACTWASTAACLVCS